MNDDQRRSVTLANLMAEQYHNFNVGEYEDIKYTSEHILQNKVLLASKRSCIGVCRLGPTMHCVGCGRHVEELE